MLLVGIFVVMQNLINDNICCNSSFAHSHIYSMFKKLCIIYIRVHWVRLAVATEQTRSSTQKPNLGFCGGYPLKSNRFQVRITHNSISNCFVKAWFTYACGMPATVSLCLYLPPKYRQS